MKNQIPFCISNALDYAGDGLGARLDQNVKQLLADKQILSRILKYTMEEFSDMEYNEDQVKKYCKPYR